MGHISRAFVIKYRTIRLLYLFSTYTMGAIKAEFLVKALTNPRDLKPNSLSSMELHNKRYVAAGSAYTVTYTHIRRYGKATCQYFVA